MEGGRGKDKRGGRRQGRVDSQEGFKELASLAGEGTGDTKLVMVGA